MCFRIMHIVSNFQSFIRIFTVVKLKNTNQHFKKRGKGGVFFKVTYLNELISYKFHIYVKVMLIILSITCLKML